MKHILTVIFLLFVTSSIYSWNTVLPKYRQMVRKEGKLVKVLEILDARTISVTDLRKNVYHVGLLGIDMDYLPSQGKIEEKAVTLMKKLILNKTVYLLFDEKEKKSGENPRVLLYYPYNIKYLLNATLLEAGLAKCNSAEKHWLKDDFLVLEKIAKAKKIGLWSQEIPDSKINIPRAEKPAAPDKMFSNADLVAQIFAELTLARKDSDKLKAVYKRYGLDKKNVRESFFSSVLYFADDEEYRKKLREKLKKGEGK